MTIHAEILTIYHPPNDHPSAPRGPKMSKNVQKYVQNLLGKSVKLKCIIKGARRPIGYSVWHAPPAAALALPTPRDPVALWPSSGAAHLNCQWNNQDTCGFHRENGGKRGMFQGHLSDRFDSNKTFMAFSHWKDCHVSCWVAEINQLAPFSLTFHLADAGPSKLQAPNTISSTNGNRKNMSSPCDHH